MFNNQGQARIAAETKLVELTVIHGSVFRIEHHPAPSRGLPHYHVYHISHSKRNYQGHFFYRTKKRKRQYKVEWKDVYNVMVVLGLSVSLIAVILAALVDPEPASKLALAGLSAVMISQILEMLDEGKENEA